MKNKNLEPNIYLHLTVTYTFGGDDEYEIVFKRYAPKPNKAELANLKGYAQNVARLTVTLTDNKEPKIISCNVTSFP